MTEPASRRRLLFLSQILPHPPHGGVQIRTYNILRLLAGEFRTTALCFYRHAFHPTQEAVDRSVEALRSMTHVEAYPIPQEQSRLRLLRDHALSVLSGRVYTVHSYRSDRYRGGIEQLLSKDGFDIVHMDSLDLADYLPDVAHLPTVCTHHNVESALLERRARQESSLARRLYLRYQSMLMRREEARWAPRVDLNATVSAEDARRLREIAPEARVTVVPNGVDTTLFDPHYSGSDGIVFVGGYTWFPNRDALVHFAQDILPLIRSQAPEVPVRWIGNAPEEIRADYGARHGMELTGYVDSIEPYVAAAGCYVVPLRVGGGTRLKILDAWALGKAVVSTSVGCEGLDARDSENILIRDNPKPFAEAVLEVLRDPDLRSRLGKAGRRTAETTYDWRVIGHRFMPLYHRLANGDGKSG